MKMSYWIGGAIAVFVLARYLGNRTKNNAQGIAIGERHPLIDDSKLIM